MEVNLFKADFLKPGVNNGGVGDEANRSLLAYSNVFNV